MISFERLKFEDLDWDEIETYDNINIFQTRSWLMLLSETFQGVPIIARVRENGQAIGYFTGLIFKKFGIKILGSPFRGWGTYFMGFNLKDEYDSQIALQYLPEFAFRELGCHYIEVIDPCVRLNNNDSLSLRYERLNWFALDITLDEDKLFARMKSSGRNCIRKAIKSGVVVENVQDVDFANEYYSQYESVLAIHNLSPTYSLDFVKRMLEFMLSRDSVILLRSKTSEGQSIATGIFLMLNKTAVFWGAASLREYQSLRPNEILAWEGIKRLKAQGIQTLHLGGEANQYKEKLGCIDAEMYRMIKASNRILDWLTDTVTSPQNAKYRNWMLRKF